MAVEARMHRLILFLRHLRNYKDYRIRLLLLGAMGALQIAVGSTGYWLLPTPLLCPSSPLGAAHFLRLNDGKF